MVVMEDKELDVSINFCCWIALFPLTCGAAPYKTTLLLEQDEVTKTDIDLCGTHITKRLYREVGSVDRGSCFCCLSVNTSLGSISPGCGCEKVQVDEIINDLRQRIRHHQGDGALLYKVEETLQQLNRIDTRLNYILDHLQIPIPDKMTDRGDHQEEHGIDP